MHAWVQLHTQSAMGVLFACCVCVSVCVCVGVGVCVCVGVCILNLWPRASRRRATLWPLEEGQLLALLLRVGFALFCAAGGVPN